jgi:hypothetical protein
MYFCFEECSKDITGSNFCFAGYHRARNYFVNTCRLKILLCFYNAYGTELINPIANQVSRHFVLDTVQVDDERMYINTICIICFKLFIFL